MLAWAGVEDIHHRQWLHRLEVRKHITPERNLLQDNTEKVKEIIN